jgi:glycosyltransferase involved in cell wall biosynthesis
MQEQVGADARERIQFVGPRSANEITQLRRKSAFALVGSRFENFAYSIAESMALGMPVLASDSFGNAEMIRDKLDGRIVPIGNIELMADAIVDMASDPAQLAKMGASAYARAANLLSPERVAHETLAVYRQAIARMRSE